MSYLFLKELNESNIVNEEILTEDFDDVMDSFMSYAERKLKGYSVKELDYLAKKARNIDSEVKKRDTLSRIDSAINDAKKDLATTKDENKKKELRLQIQTLGELRSKVNSFKLVDTPNKDNDEDTHHKRVINLDDN